MLAQLQTGRGVCLAQLAGMRSVFLQVRAGSVRIARTLAEIDIPDGELRHGLLLKPADGVQAWGWTGQLWAATDEPAGALIDVQVL